MDNKAYEAEIMSLAKALCREGKDGLFYDNAIDRVVRSGNQEALAVVAKGGEYVNHREEALEALNDLRLLADVAKNGEWDNTKQAAERKLWSLQSAQTVDVKDITDQAELAEFIKNCTDFDKCIELLNNLTDQALIADVAENACYFMMRMAAADKSGDTDLEQKVYAEIVKDIDYYNTLMRLEETIKFNDSTLLKIANYKEFRGELREEMLKILFRRADNAKDQALFAEIAKVDYFSYTYKVFLTYCGEDEIRTKKVEDIQWEAAQKLTDPKLLEDVAKNAESSDIRFKVAYYLQSEKEKMALLADIAENDEEEDIRNWAANELKELKEKEPVNQEPVRQVNEAPAQPIKNYVTPVIDDDDDFDPISAQNTFGGEYDDRY